VVLKAGIWFLELSGNVLYLTGIFYHARHDLSSLSLSLRVTLASCTVKWHSWNIPCRIVQFVGWCIMHLIIKARKDWCDVGWPHICNALQSSLQFFKWHLGINRITYWSQSVASLPHKCQLPSPPLDNIQVMVIVWKLRGNIIRTALCWVVWHNVHSQQHTHMSSSYRSSRLGLSNWDPYAMHRGGWIELYYCNMVEWCWWDSSLICKTNWFPLVLGHCWFGHMTCKNLSDIW